MNFFREMLSSDAKISSKRFVGFAAFAMLILSWGADTFSGFEVKDKILDCSTSIFISKCHLTFLEKYVNIKNFCKEFRNYLPYEYQIKFYPTFNKLICVN